MYARPPPRKIKLALAISRLEVRRPRFFPAAYSVYLRACLRTSGTSVPWEEAGMSPPFCFAADLRLMGSHCCTATHYRPLKVLARKPQRFELIPVVNLFLLPSRLSLITKLDTRPLPKPKDMRSTSRGETKGGTGLSRLFCCVRSRKSPKSEVEESAHRPDGQDAGDAQGGSRPPQSDEMVIPVKRQPTTGLRKPGHTAAAPDCHEHDGFDFKEAQPNDYLYFGQPGEASQGGGTHTTAAAHGKHTGAGSPSQRPTSTSPGSGKDDSGFLNSGLSNQQMGYQNLTYGGSLQYDYSGTHRS